MLRDTRKQQLRSWGDGAVGRSACCDCKWTRVQIPKHPCKSWAWHPRQEDPLSSIKAIGILPHTVWPQSKSSKPALAINQNSPNLIKLENCGIQYALCPPTAREKILREKMGNWSIRNVQCQAMIDAFWKIKTKNKKLNQGNRERMMGCYFR